MLEIRTFPDLEVGTIILLLNCNAAATGKVGAINNLLALDARVRAGWAGGIPILYPLIFL